jgi:hypothetical protein
MENSRAPTTTENIAQAILVIRGHRVLLDSEIAALFGVATKVPLQSVRRKSERFEATNVTSNALRGSELTPECG